MSLRAIIIGIALVIIQTAVTPYNDYYLQGTDISGSHFPLGALFALIVLTLGINPVLKKITPKAELNPGELMIVWVMLVVTSAIPSKGMMGYLLPYLVAPRYFDTPENEWADTLYPHLPEWLVVWDKQASSDFLHRRNIRPMGAVGKTAFCLDNIYHRSVLCHNLFIGRPAEAVG